MQVIESLGRQKGLLLMNIRDSEYWSILSAYIADSFITWEVLQSSFTIKLFEKFIEFKVLPQCNSYPAE